MNKVFETKFGSHLYGTETPESDTDIRGVYIPTKKDLYLGRAKPVISLHKGPQERKNSVEDIDEEYWSLHHFIKKLANGEVTALDLAFADQTLKSDFWDFDFYLYRSYFLTRNVGATLGYIYGQAAKYGIKGSRVAAAEKAYEFFRSKPVTKVGYCDLTSLLILDHIEETSNLRPDGSREKMLEVCGKKVLYTQTTKEAAGTLQRMVENYGKRAKQARDNLGVDWKALSHAIRSANQCKELLLTEHITFPRPEAAHLLEIKLGKCDYADVNAELEELLEEVESLKKSSLLPMKVEQSIIDDFTYEVYRYYNN